LHRITHVRHNDGNRSSCLLGSESGWGWRCHKNINIQPDQLCREIRKPLASSCLTPSGLDDKVFSLNVTEVAHSLAKCLQEVSSPRSRSFQQITYPVDFRRPLRLGRQA